MYSVTKNKKTISLYFRLNFYCSGTLDFYILICYTSSMKNISKKSIFLSLGLLAILVFGTIVFIPTKTEARTIRFIRMGTGQVIEHNYDNLNNEESERNTVVSSATKSNYPNTIGNRTTNSSSSNNNSSNSTSTNSTKTTETVKSSDTSTTKTDDDVVASDVNESYGNLSANALFGSNGFMPTGLVQWIILTIVILAIIFLWRYVHAEEKYLAEPLKHA